MVTPARGGEPRAAARQSTLRESNLSLVVRTALGASEPLSRAGVAARTSMTRSTVSRLTDELVEAQILSEAARVVGGQRGRPAAPLMAGKGFAALGLQVNASLLAARVIDLGGRVLAEELEPGNFVGSDPAPTLSLIAELGRSVLSALPDDVHLVGAGLALPGIVAQRDGRLLSAPNLGWSDVEPEHLLPPEALGGRGVRIGNEADLAALTVAEAAPGRPGRFRDFLYLSGEIGIGGAAVLDGRLLAGRHGWAGEFGHVCVDPHGPPCRCGSTGCLEQYAGRRALMAAAGLSPSTSTHDLATRAAEGEPRAVQALESATWALGVALASVVNVLDITTIVLGGHLARLHDLVGEDLERQLSSRVLSARWISPELAGAASDVAPGATGAAFRELAGVLDDPARWI